MRSRLLFVFPAVTVLLIAGSCGLMSKSKNKRLPGVWQEQPIVVDGGNSDWTLPYPGYDDKAMLGYAVSNDKDNLYITIETGDAATQLKILRGGLTVWIDKTGGKEENAAINYPIPAYASEQARKEKESASSAAYWLTEQDRNAPMQKRLLDLREKVKKALGEANEYSLQGFKGCNFQFPLEAQNSCGIVVRVDIDKDNELIWEATIPFKAFYYKSELTRADNGKPLSIGIETTGFKSPDGQSGSTARGGGRRGNVRPSFSVGMGMGMGMQFGGGGMRGRNNGGAPEPQNILGPLFTSSKTWKKFGVAYK